MIIKSVLTLGVSRVRCELVFVAFQCCTSIHALQADGDTRKCLANKKVAMKKSRNGCVRTREGKN
jgi:hypothetical protein